MNKILMALLLSVLSFSIYATPENHGVDDGIDADDYLEYYFKHCNDRCPPVVIIRKKKDHCVKIQYRVGRNPAFGQETDIPPRHFDVMNSERVSCERFTRPLLEDKIVHIRLPQIHKHRNIHTLTVF